MPSLGLAHEKENEGNNNEIQSPKHPGDDDQHFVLCKSKSPRVAFFLFFSLSLFGSSCLPACLHLAGPTSPCSPVCGPSILAMAGPP